LIVIANSVAIFLTRACDDAANKKAEFDTLLNSYLFNILMPHYLSNDS
jgi:hypothetical protein